jgi:hypothetical protein
MVVAIVGASLCARGRGGNDGERESDAMTLDHQNAMNALHPLISPRLLAEFCSVASNR